jgi:hypothetical protein
MGRGEVSVEFDHNERVHIPCVGPAHLSYVLLFCVMFTGAEDLLTTFLPHLHPLQMSLRLTDQEQIERSYGS